MQTDQPVSPYMLQRWLSMYSPQVAMLVNATTNRVWASVASDPQAFVDLLDAIVPKLPFARISYIKKPSTEAPTTPHSTVIEIISQMLRISQREATQYIEQDPSLVDRFADSVEVFRKTRLNPADDTN